MNRCRVGIHGRNDHTFHSRDYDLIRDAKIETVKMMSITQVGVFKQLHETFPDLELITRLYDDRMREGYHPTAAQFADKFAPLMQQLKPYVTKFEIHNEPNHLRGIEGWGQENSHAQDFNLWFQDVYNRLKSSCPWAELGFPGLAIPHRDLEWVEICRPAVEMADWLGVHCFPGNSLVIMGGGATKPIKEVLVGDCVITHTGSIKKVTKISRRTYKGRLLEIKAVGSESVQCTPEHPFYIKKRKVSRKYLGDESSPEWLIADRMREGDYACYPRMKSLPPTEYTEDQLWVMGLWLAEGSCGRKNENTGEHYSVVFSMGSHERPVLEKARNILCEWWGKETGSIHEGAHGQLSLHFSGIEITRLFKRLMGYKAPSKQLSDELFNRAHLLPLIRGFAAGDGHTKKINNNLVLSTTSRNLAFQLRQILLNERRWATLYRRKRKSHKPSVIDGREVISKHTEWIIEIGEKDANDLYPQNKQPGPRKSKRNYSWNYEDEDAIWPLIRSIKQVGSEDDIVEVFNLEVEDDHSYLVNGLAVHNCYWQNPTNAAGNHLSVVWGLRFRQYHDKFPDKMIEITEFGNSNCHNPNYPLDDDVIAQEYVEYYQELFSYDYVNSANSFLMSAPQGEWAPFCWRYEDGEYKPVVMKVGQMSRPAPEEEENGEEEEDGDEEEEESNGDTLEVHIHMDNRELYPILPSGIGINFNHVAWHASAKDGGMTVRFAFDDQLDRTSGGWVYKGDGVYHIPKGDDAKALRTYLEGTLPQLELEPE